MSEQPQLDTQRFFKRLQTFFTTWANKIPEIDAFSFITGRGNLALQIPQTIGLHHWLMGYHLTDTCFFFKPDSLTILTSMKKSKLGVTSDKFLEEVKKVKSQIEVKIIIKAKEIEPFLEQVEDVLETVLQGAQRVGYLAKEMQALKQVKEEHCGKAMKKIETIYQDKGLKMVAMPHFLEDCRAVLDGEEQLNIEIAGALSTIYLKKALEKILEQPRSYVAQICSKIELQANSDKLLWRSILQKYPNTIKHQCESTVFIQQARISGTPVELYMPSHLQKDDDSKLQPRGAFYLTCVARYQEYNVQCVRTLFVDVKTETTHQAIYPKIEKIHAFVMSRIRAGVKLGEVYDESIAYIGRKYTNLLHCFEKCLGWGTGPHVILRSREIAPGSPHVIREGECYAIRTCVYDAEGVTLAIGDTVLVEGGGSHCVTQGFGSAFQDVDHYRAKHEEEDVKRQAADEIEAELDSGDQDVMDNPGRRQAYTLPDQERKISLRSRRAVNTEGNRDERQRELMERKVDELVERLKQETLDTKEKHQVIRWLGKLRAYKEKREFEALKLKKGQIQIDSAHDVVIIPFEGKMVPLHIGMIRNVSKNEEGTRALLRLNFFTQETAGLQSGINVICPSYPDLWYGHEREPGEAGEDQTAIFIKELIFQSADKDRFANLFKALKDSIKRIRMLEQEQRDRVDLVAQPMLQLGRRAKLSNVTLRPSPTNRKIMGNLELHSNGYRFISNSEKVPFHLDITTNNIKHAFYQPATSDVLIVTIHLHLRSPIFIANKKKTVDVQFFREVTVQFEEVGGVYKRRGIRAGRTDQDEVELERQEREHRKKINGEFRDFCRLAQDTHMMKYEKPERSLGFYGVPERANMLIMPTVNCLVALTEIPFFVVSLADIDLFHFERVNYTSKSFDIALIFKDLTTWKRISNVPVDSLEMLKNWITEKELIFTESAINMNWTNTLAQIRHQPEEFIKEGGWLFLADKYSENEGKEAGDESDDGDSSFNASEELDESSESETSYDESSSSYVEEEEAQSESEDGMSWDELEKKAIEEERRERNAGPNKKRKHGRY